MHSDLFMFMLTAPQEFVTETMYCLSLFFLKSVSTETLVCHSYATNLQMFELNLNHH